MTKLELKPQDQAGQECPVCGSKSVDRGEYYDRLEDYCQRCGLLVKYRSKLHDVKKEPGDQLALIRKLEQRYQDMEKQVVVLRSKFAAVEEKHKRTVEILTAVRKDAVMHGAIVSHGTVFVSSEGLCDLLELWGIE